MNVNILETKSGKVVATYQVSLGGFNYTPSDEEYFNVAWSNAVDDGLIPDDERDNYSFKIL
jgi:hypothetical protein